MTYEMASKLELSTNLRLLMARRGITAAHLSRSVKVPKSTVSGWIAGHSPKNLEQVVKVAEYFGVTLDELCLGPTSKQSITSEENWNSGVFEIRYRRINSRSKK